MNNNKDQENMEVENNDEFIVEKNKNRNGNLTIEKEKGMEIEIERSKRKRRFKPVIPNQKRRIESPPIVVSKKKENN